MIWRIRVSCVPPLCPWPCVGHVYYSILELYCTSTRHLSPSLGVLHVHIFGTWHVTWQPPIGLCVWHGVRAAAGRVSVLHRGAFVGERHTHQSPQKHSCDAKIRDTRTEQVRSTLSTGGGRRVDLGCWVNCAGADRLARASYRYSAFGVGRMMLR